MLFFHRSAVTFFPRSLLNGRIGTEPITAEAPNTTRPLRQALKAIRDCHSNPLSQRRRRHMVCRHGSGILRAHDYVRLLGPSFSSYEGTIIGALDYLSDQCQHGSDQGADLEQSLVSFTVSLSTGPSSPSSSCGRNRRLLDPCSSLDDSITLSPVPSIAPSGQ